MRVLCSMSPMRYYLWQSRTHCRDSPRRSRDFHMMQCTTPNALRISSQAGRSAACSDPPGRQSTRTPNSFRICLDSSPVSPCHDYANRQKRRAFDVWGGCRRIDDHRHSMQRAHDRRASRGVQSHANPPYDSVPVWNSATNHYCAQ